MKASERAKLRSSSSPRSQPKREGEVKLRVLPILDTEISHFCRVSREPPYGEWLIKQTNQFSADLLEQNRASYVPLLVRMLRDAHQNGDIYPASLALSVKNHASTLIAAAHGLALKDAAFVAARVFSHRLRGMVRAILRDIQDS